MNATRICTYASILLSLLAISLTTSMLIWPATDVLYCVIGQTLAVSFAFMVAVAMKCNWMEAAIIVAGSLWMTLPGVLYAVVGIGLGRRIKNGPARLEEAGRGNKKEQEVGN